ncbi:MAG: sugar ABC transporter permease [Propionibacteriaceae bacterium]|jgi:arabinogalactan oligomer/maltooligosaccharide transport system permease protein|nr:sugar ABC transporter permease [Propionibacteriaceae bacterium]
MSQTSDSGSVLEVVVVDPTSPKHKSSAQHRRRWWTEVGWRYIVGAVMLVFAGFPILYVIGTSLNPVGSVTAGSIIPKTLTLSNYTTLFSGQKGPFWRWYLNTLIVCAFTAVTQIVASTLAAYAFSRLRFKGRRGGMLFLLLIMMFPNILSMIAIYTIFTQLGQVFPGIGLSTVLGYCIALTGGALGQVWLIKGTLDTVPKELDEAAIIDGATHFQVFSQILLPTLVPIIAVTTLLGFVGVISEFLIGTIFLTDNNSKTLAVGLYGMLTTDKSNNFGIFAAGAVLVAVPVIALFQFLQKYIVGGSTSGAVKG